MSRKFYVMPGYLARNGACWYDHSVMLILEEDETVVVYAAREGQPGTCVGIYSCPEFDSVVSPNGLRIVE